MRLLCLSVCLLSVASAQPQGGFFSGINNAFGNLFGGSSNRPPPPPQRRPPPPQNFQPQPQQFQQAQFQPQQQQFIQPQQPQFQSQPVEAPQFRPQPQPAPVQQAPLRQVVSQPQSQRLTGGTSLCGAQEPNHFWTDPRDNIQRGYVVTWKFGCSTFQQHEARAYCQSMGMEPVSLDSPAKQDEFNRLIAQDAQRYFWTGGIVDHAQQTVFWSNGAATPVPFSASAHWSHTGGADRPQPDNRAASEVPPTPEVCLGVLNNFYADGIKWHDVACHHKKPTVCEPRS